MRLFLVPVSTPVIASGFHAPLVIAIPIIAAVVVLRVALARRGGRPTLAGRIIVRCNRGHLFTVVWSPWGSLRSIRLGFARFQRCPVGNHWALVRPVNDADLSDEERRTAEHQSD